MVSVCCSRFLIILTGILSVPIYDAPNFKFTPEALEQIKTLPRYRQGKKDLSEWSAVTIGYSVGKYEMKQGVRANWPTLAPYILFVLHHGMVDETTFEAVSES